MSDSGQSIVGEHEPRWHASIAVLLALALYITLPPRLTIGPAWIAPLIVLAILVPLSVISPHRHQTRSMRFWGIFLIAIVNFFNATSMLLLIGGFFHPAKAAALQSAPVLLRHGMQIWITNILVFALWFWELDGGGPEARAHSRPSAQRRAADFLFPQMQLAAMGNGSSRSAEPVWKPMFFDYVYVAFTNATAFSPTDTMPLSRWAKFLMLAEAMLSLLTIAIILARAVSLIQ